MLDDIHLQFRDNLGSDLTVVDAARVSFDKTSSFEFSGPYASPEIAGEALQQDPYGQYGIAPHQGQDGWFYSRLSAKDVSLVNYLAEHNHWSPFSHVMVQMRIKMPLGVARQWYKHRIGVEKDCGWNEVSRRYVSDTPEFFFPEKFRGAPDKAKQGSSEKFVETIFSGKSIHAMYAAHMESSKRLYEEMIRGGVAPEQARFVLPTATYTEWIETGSLMAYARICKLRLDPHAQQEVRDYAEKINQGLAFAFPVSWKALANVPS